MWAFSLILPNLSSCGAPECSHFFQLSSSRTLIGWCWARDEKTTACTGHILSCVSNPPTDRGCANLSCARLARPILCKRSSWGLCLSNKIATQTVSVEQFWTGDKARTPGNLGTILKTLLFHHAEVAGELHLETWDLIFMIGDLSPT